MGVATVVAATVHLNPFSNGPAPSRLMTMNGLESRLPVAGGGGGGMAELLLRRRGWEVPREGSRGLPLLRRRG